MTNYQYSCDLSHGKYPLFINNFTEIMSELIVSMTSLNHPWRNFHEIDQLCNLIKELQKAPDRKHMVSLSNDIQFSSRSSNTNGKGYLDCHVFQKSVDNIEQMANNISTYALVTYILCVLCDKTPGKYTHTFRKIYPNIFETDQFKKIVDSKPEDLPTLFVNDEFWNPNRDEDDRYKRLNAETITWLLKGINLEDFQLALTIYQ